MSAGAARGRLVGQCAVSTSGAYLLYGLASWASHACPSCAARQVSPHRAFQNACAVTAGSNAPHFCCINGCSSCSTASSSSSMPTYRRTRSSRHTVSTRDCSKLCRLCCRRSRPPLDVIGSRMATTELFMLSLLSRASGCANPNLSQRAQVRSVDVLRVHMHVAYVLSLAPLPAGAFARSKTLKFTAVPHAGLCQIGDSVGVLVGERAQLASKWKCVNCQEPGLHGQTKSGGPGKSAESKEDVATIDSQRGRATRHKRGYKMTHRVHAHIEHMCGATHVCWMCVPHESGFKLLLRIHSHCTLTRCHDPLC